MQFSLVYKGLECLDLKEKNRKQICHQIKNIQSRVQKKSDARVYRLDQYIPDRSRVDTSLPAHYRPGTCATYSAQTAYREDLSERDLFRRR